MMSMCERVMMRLVEEVHLDAIDTCARVYGFSASEAKSKIGNVVLMCGGVMEKKAKTPVEKKISSKVKLALPFSGAVLAGCCGGLKQNHGLLSQCTNEVSSGYCSGCKKQCDKNASGKPDCGSIEDRMTAFTAGVDFRDPKGRAPVAYAKVMQKLKITEEEVLAEVAKFNVTFNRDHFAMPESKRGRPKKEGSGSKDTDSDAGSKKRGRPKKAPKAVEVSSTEDLFATLISEVKASSPRAEVPVPVPAPVPVPIEAVKKSKEAEKAAKEQEKQAAKAAKEQEKLAAKAAKEADKLAAKAAKEPKAKKATVPVPVPAPAPAPVPVEEEEEEEEEEELVVTKFEFKGKTYLRTKANVLYDAKTQDCVGVFNDSLQVIEECELEEESEVEESDDE